jgi:hypothetical protein
MSTEKLCKFSLRELTDTFRYDPDMGKLYSNLTGKSVGFYSNESFLVSKRTGHKITQLRAGQLCWFLHYKELPKGDVWYRDEDCTNIKINNLLVVKRGTKHFVSSTSNKIARRSWVNTSNDRILYNELRNLWCVQRGKKDAVYWSRSLEEALFVRDEYLADKTIQRRDFYHNRYTLQKG